MDYEVIKYLNECLKLAEDYGFHKANEINDEYSYSIEYISKAFVFLFQTYHQEMYVTIYKTGCPKRSVDLINLLNYINQPITILMYDFYIEEKDLNERYKKQLRYLSNIIYANLTKINNFLSSTEYELKLSNLRMYMINKYPNLFEGG